ncbi:centrosomal protein of 78 kDa-like isoform X2 [Hydractinia symbiolongicarpus]|uniref:centrosomal protein of 78 kDa-like isoform X2 n=1 Tax=Hydractinia symbiolongicarpus TaxID=13093 RepID=UPI00254E3509|nr:centrosomal protein of 78 kDa-like isoform X2 [Hydractinia symbiolongicarpus]
MPTWRKRSDKLPMCLVCKQIMNGTARTPKSKHHFETEYNRLCLIQNTCPLSYIKANLKDNFLDFNADRVDVTEWDPILGGVKSDNSLRYIAVRSLWQPSDVDKGKKETSGKKKIPAIRFKDMTLKLARSLKDCLSTSTCIECLILQNLPFHEQDVVHLAKGINVALSLKYLSFEHSRLGDKFFKVLCPAMRKSTTLISVNFTGCGLSWKSMEEIAEIIKYQATRRHGEAWKDSLRYRRPDLDQMEGLRRITLCENNIGDYGARILADALKDDLWLKALDLQHCGISTDGASILKDSLTFNKAMLVLDVRRNPHIDYELLRSIIEQVMINAGGEHPEYPWQSGKDKEEKSRPTQRRPRFNVCKKTQSKIGRSRRRSSLDTGAEHYPWRTAERIKSNRYRRKNPLNGSVSEPFTAMQALRKKKTSRNNNDVQNGDVTRFCSSRRMDKVMKQSGLAIKDYDSDDFTTKRGRNPPNAKFVNTQDAPGCSDKAKHISRTRNDNVFERTRHDNVFERTRHGNLFERTQHDNEGSLHNDMKKDTYLNLINELRMEVDLYREKLEKEKLLRLIAEEKVNKLETEKEKLLRGMNNRNTSKAERAVDKTSMRNGSNNVLEDDNILDSIESSFEQFQQFLDMLKDLGLGDLYTQMQQKQLDHKKQTP